ncbi:MAG: hypothetical protein RR359_01895 [Bacilli bacterium]
MNELQVKYYEETVINNFNYGAELFDEYKRLSNNFELKILSVELAILGSVFINKLLYVPTLITMIILGYTFYKQKLLKQEQLDIVKRMLLNYFETECNLKYLNAYITLNNEELANTIYEINKGKYNDKKELDNQIDSLEIWDLKALKKVIKEFQRDMLLIVEENNADLEKSLSLKCEVKKKVMK